MSIQPAWKSLNLQLKTSRIVWSSYIQLKLDHDHFRSYLKRLSDYDSDKCNYNDIYIQFSAHLLTSCSKYQIQHSKIKKNLSISDNLSLKLLLTTRERIQAVFDFLKETEIARRNWLSEWVFNSWLNSHYYFWNLLANTDFVNILSCLFWFCYLHCL